MIEYPTKDWLATIMRLRGTILPRVIGRTLAVAILTVALLLLRNYTELDVSIPATAHAMVGVALGLLLVFRTNESYARYWEGRILLGGLVNNCRDLARQCRNYMPNLPQEAKKEIAGNIVAYAAVMVAYLREESAYAAAEPHIGKVAAAPLDALGGPPLAIATRMAERFVREADEGRLAEMRLRTLDACVSDLIDLWGGCERILKTPVLFATPKTNINCQFLVHSLPYR